MKNLLTKTIAPVALIVVLGSCSSEESAKDEQFCKCMQTADALNKYSSELLKRTPTAEDEKEMKRLRKNNERDCSRYYMMSGEEMLKRKKACRKK